MGGGEWASNYRCMLVCVIVRLSRSISRSIDRLLDYIVYVVNQRQSVVCAGDSQMLCGGYGQLALYRCTIYRCVWNAGRGDR